MLKHGSLAVVLFVMCRTVSFAAAPTAPGGPLGVPTPLFPATNWWNTDVSAAPLDPSSSAFITHMGGGTPLHPDFGGNTGPSSSYGIPYVVVDGAQPRRSVLFQYWDESDGGVNATTHRSGLFYPIPDAAITDPYWIEGGQPGNANVNGDRHMLIVDREHNWLYELYALRWTGSEWAAGSGAFFDMNTNNRRPEGWTSADAAGLAILPGLVQYDEVFGTGPIRHAFRVTVNDSNGYVFPGSHVAGTAAGALPMGARLRLKATKNISTYAPEVQRIFQAMKTYGLIVADNGSNMYITGTYDTRWVNGQFNTPFGTLTANDFEVVKLGWQPPTNASIADASTSEGLSGNKLLGFAVTLDPAPPQAVTIAYATASGSATSGSDFVAKSGTLSFAPGVTQRWVTVAVNGDALIEGDETFTVTLSSPVNATIVRATATGTIVDDDPAPAAPAIDQYRLYYPITAEHLYTADFNEYNTLGTRGWAKEGKAYKVFGAGGTYAGAFTVPFYRLYNAPTRQHHWTDDANEASTLAARPDWTYEGISSYVLAAPAGAAVPLYRLVLTNPLVHLWTTDANERFTLTHPPNHWTDEGIAAYVVP